MKFKVEKRRRQAERSEEGDPRPLHTGSLNSRMRNLAGLPNEPTASLVLPARLSLSLSLRLWLWLGNRDWLRSGNGLGLGLGLGLTLARLADVVASATIRPARLSNGVRGGDRNSGDGDAEDSDGDSGGELHVDGFEGKV